jgi:quinoprotein glucose dehydrogenase
VTIPKTGKPEQVGIMVTKTLVFAGEGGGLFAAAPYTGGPLLRAIDKKTGEVISEFKLPANQTGIPMTYMVNGKQYIVVAVGARNSPAELVALTLP